MKTVGLWLRETRLKKCVELSDVAKATKIRENFIELIENDDYSKLPNGAVARGFVANYAQYLGLNVNTIQAMFRRDFSENQLGQIVPRGMISPINKLNYWTPKKTVVSLIILGLFIFLVYLTYQYLILIGPPSLVLKTPKINQIIDSEIVEVAGTTDPQATLSVNGQLVILDKEGNFDFKLPISQGENKILVQAIGKSKKISQIERTVYYKK